MKSFNGWIVRQNNIMWSHRLGIRNLGGENYENGIRKFIIDGVKDKNLFVDIGASLGVHAINLSKNFKRVIAIEPYPLNIQMMSETLFINKITNVDIYRLAAWNRPAILKLFRSSGDATDGGMFVTDREKKKNSFVDEVEVIGVPMDFLNMSPSCVKIDVEGGELEVLEGMKETLKYEKPVVIVEIHVFLEVSVSDVEEFFKNLGYEKHANLNKDRLVSYDVFWSGDSLEDFNPEDYKSEISVDADRVMGKPQEIIIGG